MVSSLLNTNPTSPATTHTYRHPKKMPKFYDEVIKLISPIPQQSLRIIPADAHTSSFSHISDRTPGAPSAPGLHDTLRAGVGPSPYDSLPSTSTTKTGAKPISAHPLEARLKQWEATRDALRMETLRRAYGIAEPIRRGMELKITREGEWRPLALPGSGVPGVHEEILAGKDDMITWEDVYTNEDSRAAVPVHEEMERKLKIH
jgi:proteasome maturation protein